MPDTLPFADVGGIGFSLCVVPVDSHGADQLVRAKLDRFLWSALAASVARTPAKARVTQVIAWN